MVGGGNEERMILSDQQREENFQEYLRLRQDPNYYDVTFDILIPLSKYYVLLSMR